MHRGKSIWTLLLGADSKEIGRSATNRHQSEFMTKTSGSEGGGSRPRSRRKEGREFSAIMYKDDATRSGILGGVGRGYWESRLWTRGGK